MMPFPSGFWFGLNDHVSKKDWYFSGSSRVIPLLIIISAIAAIMIPSILVNIS